MPRALTPKQAALRILDWARYGFDVGLIDAGIKALEPDKVESQARAPKKSGRLAATIRIAKPTQRAAVKRGFVKLGLVAGSRSRDRRKAVPYARVLQEGEVWGGGNSKKHPIRARAAAYYDGSIRTTGRLALAPYYPREVVHPGSDFPKLEYLRVNEVRVSRGVEAITLASFLRALGD